MIWKIKKILETLGYKDSDLLRVNVRRVEPIKPIFVKLKGKKDDELVEMFKGFNKRHGLRVKGEVYFSSIGEMTMKNFMDFLEEYDENYNLNYTEIEFKEMILRPAYL